MTWARLACVAAMVCAAAAFPVHADTNDPVAYQPDIIGVGRLFLIALRVPQDAPELALEVPECVRLLDRTPLPARSDLRKYYFRSLVPTQQADIVFGHPDGPITTSLEIWSFEQLREFRELKGKQLPRRWPLGETLPELKQTQTITSEATKQAKQGQEVDLKWVDMSDDEIWALQPDSTIPRFHYVNIRHGCPIHGKEIYSVKAWYPWIKDSSLPFSWKIQCPIGKEIYPSNDFANDDFTSGEFPDDGIGGGYVAPDGKHYGFIADLCQAYCHRMLSVAPQCADAYLATDDMRYVHKALVAMSRLAVEYAYLATMTHHRHRNKAEQVERLGQSLFSDGPFLRNSGFTMYRIAQPGYQMSHAVAYDKIFPAIQQDQEIMPFLHSKGFTEIENHEDLRRFLEENLFAVWMQGAMDGATSSNEPRSQMALVRMAECLNYQRGNEFMDWLYDHPRGKMRYFVTNTFFRDGAPYEATGHYNGVHVCTMTPIVEGVENLRSMRPQVYPEDKYPNLSKSRRYHSVFDFCMNTVTIDRAYPKLGDDTAGRGYDRAYPYYHKMPRRTWQTGGAAAFEHAYQIFKDPKFAWALVNAPGWQPSTDFPYTRQQIEAEAAKWPDDWNDRSSLQDGYGLAMLRSGKGDAKRALWMMYGQYRNHRHNDIMHIGLDAEQSEILGQLGYPRGGDWTYCWITHNLARQIPYVGLTATNQLFVDEGPVHVTEAFARGYQDTVGPGQGYPLLPDDWQRRMLAVIDVSDTESYYLDFYRISGGKDHWWSFHCQEGEFVTQGLKLEKQQGGTLAGPDIAYGQNLWESEPPVRPWIIRQPEMYGFVHLYNVERDRAPEPGWSADWALKNSDGLHFRMTVPQANINEVAICDGKSPTGGSPYEMKWVLMHNQQETPARTQIVNVMELYREQPVVKSVRALEVSGEDEAGFEAYGCVVELSNGRTDTIFAAADPGTVHTAAGGFEFAGRFGLYSEQDGEPARVVLVGGTRLTKNGRGVVTDAGQYQAMITSVDRVAETITVSPPFEHPERLLGKYIHIFNPVRRVAYQVLEVETTAAGTKLRLDLDSRIGTGLVTGHSDYKVETNTPFVLNHYRYYDGARLVNAERTADYRIIDVRGGALIDSQAHPECPPEKLQAEFPVGSWFEVYDYGVGDEVFWPQAVSVTEVGPAAYKVTATAKVALSLPSNTAARLASH